MPRPREILASLLVMACLGACAGAQNADERAAERAFGPQWKQLSRAAGMIFTGTFLEAESVPASRARPLPTVQVRFRVDRPIRGVQTGQVLTIQEWAGAWSMQRRLRPGQRVLLLLYSPGPLGLTSPVGGPLGQLALDASGKTIAMPAPNPPPAPGPRVRLPAPPRTRVDVNRPVALRQLERAFRRVREE